MVYMKNVIKRDSETVLPLSLRFAKEYLSALSEMQSKIGKVQESKELTTIHRALWTALIIEVGRLFDFYDKKNTISFKKLDHLKKEINKCHGEAVIEKIIKTRNTFTAHFSKNAEIVISAKEICDSNLRKILDKMDKLKIIE